MRRSRLSWRKPYEYTRFRRFYHGDYGRSYLTYWFQELELARAISVPTKKYIKRYYKF